MRRVLVVLALLAATALGACGWHPRGAETLPPQLQQLRVRAEPADPQFETRLKHALRIAAVEPSEQAGVYTLDVRVERPEPRNVALDRSARSAEQERRVTVHFSLRNGAGDLVFGPRTLEASRIYSYDPNSVIAKLDEEALIDGELQDNLIGQIMRQLGRVDPAVLK